MPGPDRYRDPAGVQDDGVLAFELVERGRGRTEAAFGDPGHGVDAPRLQGAPKGHLLRVHLELQHVVGAQQDVYEPPTGLVARHERNARLVDRQGGLRAGGTRGARGWPCSCSAPQEELRYAFQGVPERDGTAEVSLSVSAPGDGVPGQLLLGAQEVDQRRRQDRAHAIGSWSGGRPVVVVA